MSTSRINSCRGSSSVRGGRPPVPDLNKMAVPYLQQPRKEASRSPTRQTRNRSPSKASKEANEYDKSVEAGDIIDPDHRTRGPLRQRTSNTASCTAIRTENNKKRVLETDTEPQGKDKENEAIQGPEKDSMDIC